MSDAFAQRYFPNGDAIGRSFTIDSEGADVPLEIVGVVGNVKYDEPRDEQRPAACLPLRRAPRGGDGHGASVRRSVRRARVS